jgi:CheY-like chemotaxis protein
MACLHPCWGGGNVTKRRHILVVNDTPEILALFVEILETEGYRVTTDRFASSVPDLLTAIKTQSPDLVILDFIIGGEDVGWQFLQLLKMDRATRDLRVTVCTAAVRQVDELRSHLDEIGVAVVLKPFDVDDLLAAIARVWDQEEADSKGQGAAVEP